MKLFFRVAGALIIATNFLAGCGGSGGTTPPLLATAGVWMNAASLATSRYGHTATLLSNGKVLVAGSGDARQFCEVYDPAANSWARGGDLATPRNYHVASLLPDGRVVVAGGQNYLSGAALGSAERYDPKSDTWSAAGSMAVARFFATATLLRNGKVLVIGGSGDKITGLASVELYDPATNLWTPARSMATPRFKHTATLLSNGTVLVVGGSPGSSSAELYDPAIDAWSPAAGSTLSRSGHAAALLSDGRVLVAGGGPNVTSGSLPPAGDVAELYDPKTNSWMNAGQSLFAGSGQTATLLNDGNVLVDGGVGGDTHGGSFTIASAELYDFRNSAWVAAGQLTTSRVDHTATLLPDGRVLIVGGRYMNYTVYAPPVSLNSAELYVPAEH